MIHKINVFLLSLIVVFAPIYANAIVTKDQQKWQARELMRKAESITGNKSNILQAHLRKQINELGSKKTIEAVVETKPTASKVGGAMMKRIAVSPGGAAIGVYAVTQLIEAIGWVMEDGTYVKKIPEEPDSNPEYFYRVDNKIYSYKGYLDAAEQWFKKDMLSKYPFSYKSFISVEPNPNANCNYLTGSYYSCNVLVRYINGSNNPASTNVLVNRLPNPDYEPDKQPKEKTVPLTPALLGAAMLGSGYSDPDPNFNNDTVNTDNWTGVPEAYTPDPSGVGNELADALEDKADRAKPTSDGKPAPIGDPKYNNPLDNNDDANDRQWGSEDGTEGETENTEKTDPETGEKTNTGTFKLPKFCDWAMTVCEWYEGWKKTDVKLNQHIDDTKQHQTEEKGFWQSVKDWFNWTKEDNVPEKELPEEVPEQTDLELLDKIDSVNFNSAAYCPADIEVPVSFSGLGSTSISISYQPLCHMAQQARPIVILISWLLGAYIITGRNMREGD